MLKRSLTLLTLTASLFAHDMWIDNSHQLYYGHMEKKNSHGDERIVQQDEIARTFCVQGTTHFETKEKKLQSDCDALFVELEQNYYTKTPYGTKKQPKDETAMAIKSFQSVESVKRIYNNNGVTLTNSGLELTLRNDPMSIEAGDKARVSVSFNGKPKAGVTVANGDRVIGASDEEGHINVRVREPGLQNIKASYKIKSDGVKCDEIIHSTTLNFEVLK